MEEIKQPSGDAAEKGQVRLDPSAADVTYANFALVAITPEEFVVSLGVRTGDEQVVKISNKVVLSPKNAKRLAAALAQTVKLFEERYGTIDASMQAPKERNAR